MKNNSRVVLMTLVVQVLGIASFQSAVKADGNKCLQISEIVADEKTGMKSSFAMIDVDELDQKGIDAATRAGFLKDMLYADRRPEQAFYMKERRILQNGCDSVKMGFASGSGSEDYKIVKSDSNTLVLQIQNSMSPHSMTITRLQPHIYRFVFNDRISTTNRCAGQSTTTPDFGTTTEIVEAPSIGQLPPNSERSDRLNKLILDSFLEGASCPAPQMQSTNFTKPGDVPAGSGGCCLKAPDAPSEENGGKAL